MTLREIETLDNDAMNGRVAGLISRYWHRQGYKVEVGTKEGPVWSNLRYGLPPGYRGEDAIRVSAGRSRPASASSAWEGVAQRFGDKNGCRVVPFS
jgi:hypothetical protein